VRISLQGYGGAFEEGVIPRHLAYVRILYDPGKFQRREVDACDVLPTPWIQLPIVVVK
jgi:hypothetical protein